jgi:hypothetical protein
MESDQKNDVDMMAAVAGEDYFNLKLKIFCLEANKNTFSPDFIECFKRSNLLVNSYYKKISEITIEMSLQENDDFLDPSFLIGSSN